MTRRKVTLARITNESARKASLKKRRMGLLKKVNELAILCDLRACLIVFSPEDAEPLVWPSPEVARGLIDRYFALPDIERNRKATNQEAYLREKISKLQEQVNKIQKKNKEIEMEHLIYYLHHGRSLTDLSPNEAHGLIWYTREKINLLEKRSEIITHVPLRDPPPAPIVATGEGTFGAAERAAFMTEAEAEAAMVAAQAAAPVVPGGEGSSSFGVSHYPMMIPQNQYLMDQWFISKASQPPLPTAQPGGHHQQVGSGMMSFHHKNPNYMSLIREMGLPSYQHGSFPRGQASSSGSNPNMETQFLSPHQSHGSSFHVPFGLHFHQQQPHHGSMTMNPSQGIQMGLGQSQGSGGYHHQHQIMPESHFGFHPPNFMAGRFGFAPQGGGEGTSYRKGTEKGLPPTGSAPGSSWMGPGLPHFRGGEISFYGGGQDGSMVAGQQGQPFGLFGGTCTSGGETSFYGGGHGTSAAADQPGQLFSPFGGASTSGGGGSGIGEQFDISKNYWPDNSKNKDLANQ